MNKIGLRGLLAISLAGLGPLLFSPPAHADRPAYREGEIIVKFRDGVARGYQQIQSSYHRLSVVSVQRFESAPFKNFETLSIDTSLISLARAAEELMRDPAVEYVQPNFLLFAHREPNALPRGAEVPEGGPAIEAAPKDPTDLGDPAQKKAWGIAKVGADKAWEKEKGSRQVIVAVIDSGIDYNHPDLADNMWRNPAASTRLRTGIDQAGSGIADDIVGWDFVENDNRPYDLSGHGTHCAGTIGAVGGNGKGISGINQKVSLMAVRFLNAAGSGATSDGIKAIDYAISRGAKVLSNSWGGKGGLNRALRDAVARSEKAGVLFVASAGNDGTDNDRVPSYPGAFDLPNVIAVAATNAKDELVSFSNFGASSVDLGAPGYDIYSTKPGGGYQYLSGTSMAAPHVAGAAALLWAKNPRLGYAEIKRRILDSGDPLSSLAGKTVSGKRLNVARALEAK